MPDEDQGAGESPRNSRLLDWFREALDWEARCLKETAASVGDEVAQAVRTIAACRGRVILTGMGKMGYIARKAAATFCSTGTPALFLHPGEAFHGDLGIVCPGDLLIALSGGGETREVIDLVPFMRVRNIDVIGVTCRPQSTLARISQIVLAIRMEREADPIAEAPTASTTVALALCDAMAIAVMQSRGFSRDQFAELHPGGYIGRKMLTRVGDLMHGGARLPVVPADATVRDAILAISDKGLGTVFVVDPAGLLLGVFTDGDLRRTLGTEESPLDQPITRFMTTTPATTSADTLAAEAIRLMELRSITVLPVLDEKRIPVGVIHLHDLVQAGLV